MKIITPHHWTGWITAIIDGRWVEAKVYNQPSSLGINGGRVSKCCIGKTSTHDPTKPFFDQLDFNYDRGLDFNNLDESTLNSIIDQLEALPQLEIRDHTI